MEMNNGHEVTNVELRKLEQMLITKGWSNVHFKRVNPFSSEIKRMIDNIWSFIVE